MTGYALPFRILVNPSIGETAIVLEGLVFISAFGVVAPNDNCHILIRKNLHSIVGAQGCVVRGILQIGKELSLVHYGAVVIRVHERVADQRLESFRVMPQLRLVPRVLQSQQLAFVGRGVHRA